MTTNYGHSESSGSAMKTFWASVLTVPLLLQFGWFRIAHAQAKADEIAGRIIRYDAISNTGTANADMIIKLTKNGQFIRLLYSPHGYSFDVPAPKVDEMLPREMFSNGKIQWKFLIYPPSSLGQHLRCTSFPKKGVRDSEGKLRLYDPYIPVPGNELVVVPRVDSLPCQIVVGWGKH